jgi:hypothetical protein
MTIMQPLPRSLDPLPEESLPGYLLRLAHRLGVAPSRLATRLGLTAGRGHCSPGSLLHLPDPARDVITAATRLTHAEVDDLCLNSLGSRYPLPAPAPKSRTPARSTHSDRWVLAPATRYCPRCLAGDGSDIDRRRRRSRRKQQTRAPPDDDDNNDHHDGAFSIRAFCARHSISQSFFHKLRSLGLGPAIMKVGTRTLISSEAAAAWRRSCEIAAQQQEESTAA